MLADLFARPAGGLAAVLVFAETGCTVPNVTFVTSGDVADAADVANAGEAGDDAGDASVQPPSDASPERDETEAETAAPACAIPAGYEAGCCPQTIAPCVGVACEHCSDCALQACHANQFCCAHLGPNMAYMSVACAGDPMHCP